MSQDVLTTPVGLGAVIRFTHPAIAGHGTGAVIGRIYTNDRPWFVVRTLDTLTRVVVGLHEVKALDTPAPDAHAPLPVFKAALSPETEGPAVSVIVPHELVGPEGPQFVYVPVPSVPVPSVPVASPLDAGLKDTVRYLSPYGVMKVGVVVEIDTVSALIEVGARRDLELIDVGDIHAVLA